MTYVATHIPGARYRARYFKEPRMSVLPFGPSFVPTPQPSRESRLDAVGQLLDKLAAGVAALAAEAPTTARRLDEVEGKVDRLVKGLSKLLSATQCIAARLGAQDQALVELADAVHCADVSIEELRTQLGWADGTYAPMPADD
jgi:hypothetical protein